MLEVRDETVGTVTRTVVERGGQVGLSIQCSRLGMKVVAARVFWFWVFRVSLGLSLGFGKRADG